VIYFYLPVTWSIHTSVHSIQAVSGKQKGVENLKAVWTFPRAGVWVCCTNVIQLWTWVKYEFEFSSGVNCVAPKRFKRWSPFNSELPSDHQSNFDLGLTDECRDIIAAKNCLIRILSYLKITFSYRIIRPLMQLFWRSGYVRFLLYSSYVFFLLDKLANRWINRIFRWWCFVTRVNIQMNPNHSSKNSFVSINNTSNSIILVIWIC